ncbi:hypothetical protein J2Z69_002957 [Paenibacillus shirakamiensis]|uniref:Sigma factor regulator C-terminal domain-containing protein n=1 Tax=Paenibacillus shirakamiensis TaxID=1265935 RepID=A0ABS4JLE5_9BACL|nr:anti sigma factor C-terminal domain-containing protein [Paenibacillus shirakamiensis]MBP2001901.1 hypothetical protein [Paenibacillus shirakamiensis]
MNEHEHELEQGQKEYHNSTDDPFQKGTVQRMFVRANRITLLRNIFISTLVSLMLLTGIYLINEYLLRKTGWNIISPLELNKRITGPNLYMDKPQIHKGLLRGSVTFQEYKVIENRVIPWDDHDLQYNLLFSRKAEILSGSSAEVRIEEEGQTRFMNDKSGERQMLFYHPSLKYKNYMQDLTLLNQIHEDSYIEMGISLDKGYTLQEVDHMLPSGVHPTWYWVDSYNSGDLELMKNNPLRAEELYGFQDYSDRLSKGTRNTEATFLKDVQNVMKCSNVYYATQATKVYQAAQSHQQRGMIIGLVVTGTRDQLTQLQRIPTIKAAALGATVDKY